MSAENFEKTMPHASANCAFSNSKDENMTETMRLQKDNSILKLTGIEFLTRKRIPDSEITKTGYKCIHSFQREHKENGAPSQHYIKNLETHDFECKSSIARSYLTNEIMNCIKTDNLSKFFDDVSVRGDGSVMKCIHKHGHDSFAPCHGSKAEVHFTAWYFDENFTFLSSTFGGPSRLTDVGRSPVTKIVDTCISAMNTGEISFYIFDAKYVDGEFSEIPKSSKLVMELELIHWEMEDISSMRDGSILRSILDKGNASVTPTFGSELKVLYAPICNGEFKGKIVTNFVLGEALACKNIPRVLETIISKFEEKETSIIYFFNDNDWLKVDKTSDVMCVYVELLECKKVKEIWEMNSDEKLERSKFSKEKGLGFFKEGCIEVSIKYFKFIINCLKNEPGVAADSMNERKLLLLSAYLNISLCYLKLGAFSKAIQTCFFAICIDPNNEKAHFRRGKALMSLKNFEAALNDFLLVYKEHSNNLEAKRNIIICQTELCKQNLTEKELYKNMFRNQDKQKARAKLVETGVWSNGVDNKAETKSNLSETERILAENDNVLNAANVIEISNKY